MLKKMCVVYNIFFLSIAYFHSIRVNWRQGGEIEGSHLNEEKVRDTER